MGSALWCSLLKRVLVEHVRADHDVVQPDHTDTASAASDSETTEIQPRELDLHRCTSSVSRERNHCAGFAVRSSPCKSRSSQRVGRHGSCNEAAIFK
jgi:hypothetical protein